MHVIISSLISWKVKIFSLYFSRGLATIRSLIREPAVTDIQPRLHIHLLTLNYAIYKTPRVNPPLLRWCTNVLGLVGNLSHQAGIKLIHYDVIQWKYFPRCWPLVRGIHRSPVNYPHKGQWRGALMFSLICAWINGWVNNRETGDLRGNRAHYDIIVMWRSNLSDNSAFVPYRYCTCIYNSC